MKEKMGESIPTSDLDSKGSVEEKGPRNCFRKEIVSPLISGISFAELMQHS